MTEAKGRERQGADNARFPAENISLMVKAYRGERYKLPLAGDLAGRYAGQAGLT